MKIPWPNYSPLNPLVGHPPQMNSLVTFFKHIGTFVATKIPISKPSKIARLFQHMCSRYTLDEAINRVKAYMW